MGVKSFDWVDLVVKAQAGDTVAVRDLLQRFEPLVRSTASRLIDPDGVDDVVQSSFAVALEQLPLLRTSAAFPAWLRLIVRKQASLQRRWSSRDPLRPSEPFASDASDPASVAQERALADELRLALTAVRDDDRRLLELRYLAGWSNADLARLLRVSDGALRKRLHTARRRLRPLLEHLNPETTMTDYTRYLNQIHNASVDVPVAPTLDRPGREPTVTGLKVIDTMAPVRRGGTVEMVGPAGTGQLVVAVELLYRLGRTTNDVICVAVGAEQSELGAQRNFGHLLTEAGVPGPATAILTKRAAEAPQALTMGARLASGLAHEGAEVILIVDEATVQAVATSALIDAAGLATDGAVTVIAVRALGETTQWPTNLGFDTTLVFSVEQLALRIFPAIDPVRSNSSLGISDLGDRARRRLIHATSFRDWFNQPLFIAREYTGAAGEWAEPSIAQDELASLFQQHS